ncbi:NAD(P)H-dependent oxidoreductase [Flavobacteriaceae bacterium 3-367]
MATILALAGSNSSTSINYKLVKYTAALLTSHEVQLLNMINFPFPMYSSDYEKENGFSNSLIELRQDIGKADGIVLSVNEHNGGPSAYFKNLTDWLSRLDIRFLEGKKVLLMSTSPGKRGGVTALELTKARLVRFGGEVVATFSLPSFNGNYSAEDGIVDAELAQAHRLALDTFLAKI